jgi:hypothetical protein
MTWLKVHGFAARLISHVHVEDPVPRALLNIMETAQKLKKKGDSIATTADHIADFAKTFLSAIPGVGKVVLSVKTATAGWHAGWKAFSAYGSQLPKLDSCYHPLGIHFMLHVSPGHKLDLEKITHSADVLDWFKSSKLDVAAMNKHALDEYWQCLRTLKKVLPLPQVEMQPTKQNVPSNQEKEATMIEDVAVGAAHTSCPATANRCVLSPSHLTTLEPCFLFGGLNALHEDTLDVLPSFSQPLYVLAVVGTSRVGKSFFLNGLILEWCGRHDSADSEQLLFKTSDMDTPCTRGVWLYACQREGRSGTVIFLDVEGKELGSDRVIRALSYFTTMAASEVILMAEKRVTNTDVAFLHQLSKQNTVISQGDFPQLSIVIRTPLKVRSSVASSTKEFLLRTGWWKDDLDIYRADIGTAFKADAINVFEEPHCVDLQACAGFFHHVVSFFKARENPKKVSWSPSHSMGHVSTAMDGRHFRDFLVVVSTMMVNESWDYGDPFDLIRQKICREGRATLIDPQISMLDLSDVHSVVFASLDKLLADTAQRFTLVCPDEMLVSQAKAELARGLASIRARVAWEAWLPWSGCSQTCGGGWRQRSRSCNTGQPEDCANLIKTDPVATERDLCATSACPIDCEGRWDEWGSCSATCGAQGVRNRTFSIHVDPAHQGRECPSSPHIEGCQGAPCPPVDCSGSWSDWTPCSAPCGGAGKQYRNFDIKQSAAYGGTPCAEATMQSQPCQGATCPGPTGYPNGQVGTMTATNGGPWGDWGSWEYCPSGTLAHGFRLLSEPRQGRGDDTALNALQLRCTGSQQQQFLISSSQGPWGSWGDWRECPGASNFLRAFSLRVEGRQGSRDDTAANDIQFVCGDSYPLHGGAPTSWGDWGSTATCPANAAICGLRTKIEGRQGRRDDTALNSVEFDCCT